MNNFNIFDINLLHTTELGAKRIQRNLSLQLNTLEDIVNWCRIQILLPTAHVEKTGKNWYIYVGNFIFTVNSYSLTIITAHTRSKSC